MIYIVLPASLVGCQPSKPATYISGGQSMPGAGTAFAELRTLIGDWSGVNEEGNPVKVSYYLTANDTVLVESWFFHNGMMSLTLFHRDGTALVATHYCPIGNQPTFRFIEKSEKGDPHFAVDTVRNLADDDDPHGTGFEMRLLHDGRLVRYETYASGGVAERSGTTFTRTLDGVAKGK